MSTHVAASPLDALRGGGMALLATDTVYGLAALPGSEGEREIYRIKARPADQPLPWLVSGLGMVEQIGCSVNTAACRLAAMFWPGALTLVLPAPGGTTLALRCPDDPACLAIIEELGYPLACTSANVHGKPTPQRKDKLDAALSSVAGYSALPTEVAGQASTIVDCTGNCPVILREGPIAAHVIATVALFDDTLAG